MEMKMDKDEMLQPEAANDQEAAPEAVEPVVPTMADAVAQKAAEEAEQAAMAAELADAEERGFQRGLDQGRREALEQRMREPDLWEVARREDNASGADTEVSILNALPPCVWD